MIDQFQLYFVPFILIKLSLRFCIFVCFLMWLLKHFFLLLILDSLRLLSLIFIIFIRISSFGFLDEFLVLDINFLKVILRMLFCSFAGLLLGDVYFRASCLFFFSFLLLIGLLKIFAFAFLLFLSVFCFVYYVMDWSLSLSVIFNKLWLFFFCCFIFYLLVYVVRVLDVYICVGSLLYFSFEFCFQDGLDSTGIFHFHILLLLLVLILVIFEFLCELTHIRNKYQLNSYFKAK